MPQYEVPTSLLRRLLQRNPAVPDPPPPRNIPNNYNAHNSRPHQEDHRYESVDDLDRDAELDFIPRKPNSRGQCLNSKIFWILLIIIFLLVSFITGFTFGLIPAIWNWISGSGESNPCSPGYTWFNSTGYCYKCVVTPFTYEDALKACSSDGGSLVSVHSEAENDFVIDLYRKSLVAYRTEKDILMKRSDVWIGLVYNKETDQWEWTDGSEQDYTKWAPNEPNIMDQEQYWTKIVMDEMEGYNPYGNNWNNIGEANLLAFVCKKPDIHAPKTTKRPRVTVAPTTTTVTTTTVPPSCPAGYIFFPSTSHCYKVSLHGVDFFKAKHSCESEEAHLASIHSAEENEFLNRLYNEKLEDYNKNHEKKESKEAIWVWIGLVYLDGEWVWTDGTKLDYKNFAAGEPNKMSEHEYWTVLVVQDWPDWTPNGKEWANLDSGWWNPYFCKKPIGKQKFTTIEGPKMPVTTTVTTTTVPSTTTEAPTTTTEATTTVPPSCPAGYIFFPSTSHCYKVSLPGVSFYEAKHSCESEKAHLASIHSAEENEFLNRLYNEKLEDHNKNHEKKESKRNVWIGLVYLDGEWVWTDGTVVDYKNYAVDEPNMLAQHEYWTVMVVHLWEGWTPNANEWNNIDSNRKYAYFCKKPVGKQKFTTIEGPKIPVTTTVPPPKTCSPGYQLLVETGFCYKVHQPTAKVNMNQAEQSCRSEDAHLASIHSEEENKLLADLSRKSSEIYPASSFVSRLNEQDEVLIGLIFKDGKWEWSDGTPVDYTKWGMGEPNRLAFEWTTTLVTSVITTWNPEGQLWNNVPNSSAQRAFICKKASI